MQLPNRESARVPKEKITDYLLAGSHPDAEGKAPFFLACGFHSEEWGRDSGHAVRSFRLDHRAR